VQLEDQVGVKNVIDAATRAGLPKDTPGIEKNLTFVLGTPSPRPVDMASAFATFAARGVRADPTIIKEIVRNNGEVAYKAEDTSKRVFDEDTADGVNYGLHSVVTSGTATRASWIGRPAAGKTGTTDESKAAWFVGYTPNFSAAVMMTKADKKGRPVTLDGTGGLGSITGGSFPAAIWAEFAADALADVPVQDFVYPDDSNGYYYQPQPEYTYDPSPETTEPSDEPTNGGNQGDQGDTGDNGNQGNNRDNGDSGDNQNGTTDGGTGDQPARNARFAMLSRFAAQLFGW
jgi:membrane peptidoglycan carboxypeptidase